MLPTHFLLSVMCLPSHRFQKSFQPLTPIRTNVNSYRIGGRVPTFLLQPSASIPDLSQAPSTSRNPSRPSSSFVDLHRPSSTFEFARFPRFRFFRHSSSFYQLPRPSSSFLYLCLRRIQLISPPAFIDPPRTSPTLPELIGSNSQHLTSPFSHLCVQQLIKCIQSRDEV
jgi:hypothetical protein